MWTQASATLITRFILNLRSVELPRSHVPGENSMTENGHSVWSSCLWFADQIRSFNVVANIGAPLDHGEEDGRVYTNGIDTSDFHEEEIQECPITGATAQGPWISVVAFSCKTVVLRSTMLRCLLILLVLFHEEDAWSCFLHVVSEPWTVKRRNIYEWNVSHSWWSIHGSHRLIVRLIAHATSPHLLSQVFHVFVRHTSGGIYVTIHTKLHYLALLTSNSGS